MSDEIPSRLALAKAVARDAAIFANEFQKERGKLDVKAKASRDYVTAADLAIEAMIREHIAAVFPGDQFLGEEGGGVAAPRLWVIDPIDGTNNFARGLSQFAVSIAFCMNGDPVLGVVAEPAAERLYSAQRGKGAFCNDARIQVSETSKLTESLVDFGYTERRTSLENLEVVRRLADAGCDVRVNGSAALGLARVAEGKIDGYAELHLWSWDVLAGLLLIEEAGGLVSDFLADNGLLNGNATLACAPGIAKAFEQATGIRLR